MCLRILVLPPQPILQDSIRHESDKATLGALSFIKDAPIRIRIGRKPEPIAIPMPMPMPMPISTPMKKPMPMYAGGNANANAYLLLQCSHGCCIDVNKLHRLLVHSTTQQALPSTTNKQTNKHTHTHRETETSPSFSHPNFSSRISHQQTS